MANNKGRHDIEIHRNVIEQFLMKMRDFIKQNNKRVLYVFSGLILVFVIIVSVFVYIDGSSTDSRVKFEAVVEHYRSDPMNNDVQLKTINDLNALIEENSFGFARKMSYYVLGNIYFERKDYKSSLKMFNEFADESSSDDLFIPIAKNKAALSLEESGDTDGALKMFLEIEADSADSVIMDQVLYGAGRLYAVKGDTVKAREYFSRVMITYPESSFSSRAKERLFLLSLK